MSLNKSIWKLRDCIDKDKNYDYIRRAIFDCSFLIF